MLTCGLTEDDACELDLSHQQNIIVSPFILLIREYYLMNYRVYKYIYYTTPPKTDKKVGNLHLQLPL